MSSTLLSTSFTGILQGLLPQVQSSYSLLQNTVSVKQMFLWNTFHWLLQLTNSPYMHFEEQLFRQNNFSDLLKEKSVLSK